MNNTTLSGNVPGMNGIARFIELKRNKIVEVISALFILLFVYTATSKLIWVEDLKSILVKYPLIGNFSNLVAWSLPIVELFVALSLFIPATRLKGLFASLILMSGFTLYLIYMLLFTPSLPCTCGGMLQKLSWPQHLVLNVIYIILSLVAIRLMKKRTI
jgi:putative oxidoreductase